LVATMTDIAVGQALPVAATDLHASYAQVRSFQNERVRSVVRINKLMATVAVIALAADLALAAALAFTLPLQRVVALPILVHDADGTMDTAVSMSDMPVSMRQAVIQEAVWKYVRYREGYNFADAKYAYDLVSLMSAPNVLSEYQHSFLGKYNPDSVQIKVGKKGQINIEQIGISWVRERVALVRYWRITQMYGERPEKSSWTATVEIDFVTKITASTRMVDPGGVRVISYQSAKDST
jgi:type IV secretion system protein VirB8